MAAKKNTKKIEEPEVIEQVTLQEPEKTEEPEMKTEKSSKKEKSVEAPGPKYGIGSIVFINKEAGADLNGFKLFPQYKKYTYTVEAYDEKSGVYTLRRLNLSLRLPESLILAPEERAHDVLNRKQF